MKRVTCCVPEGGREGEVSCANLCGIDFYDIDPSRFGHMSVYLLFVRGLGLKCSSAKGFRESLSIDFRETKILFESSFYLRR